MKRASTRFWLCASSAISVLVGLGVATYSQDLKPATHKRVNELTLGGLRPGRSTLAQARDLYRTGFFTHPSADISSLASPFDNQEIEINTGAGVVLDSIRIQALEPDDNHCGNNSGWNWKTGRGLQIGDAKSNVQSLYGEPTSVSPSTKNGQPLELLYYAFNWAGPDVPQFLGSGLHSPERRRYRARSRNYPGGRQP